MWIFVLTAIWMIQKWKRNLNVLLRSYFFFFQAEDGIRDVAVTGVQTCALPIYWRRVTGFIASTPANSLRPPPVGRYCPAAHCISSPTRPCVPARSSVSYSHVCRSEERRVGKECRSRWSPDH